MTSPEPTWRSTSAVRWHTRRRYRRRTALQEGSMVAKVGGVAVDCDDVLKVAQFWAAAIDRPLDPGSSPEFASIGGADAARANPAWYFERVPEHKTAKNRMH